MKSLDLENHFDIYSATDIEYMFRDCGSNMMTRLYLGKAFLAVPS